MPTIIASPIPYPDSTGARHSWASIKTAIAGKTFMGIAKTSYGRVRSREETVGQHPDPLGKTVGENKYKCTIDLYVAEMNQLRQLLIAQAALQLGIAGVPGYGDVFFNITVQYVANGFDVIQDQIIGCTLDEETADNAKGPANLIRGINVNPLKILFAGKEDYFPSLQAPSF